MIAKTKWVLIGLSLLLLLSGCQEPAENIMEDLGIGLKKGDNPAWAEIDFDDSDWEIDQQATKEEGIFWLRISSKIKEGIPPLKNQGLLIGAAGSFDAYWDGHYLGTNGRLQTAEQDEIPGKYHTYYQLPDSLLKQGKHVLALRLTKQSPAPGFHAYYVIDDYFKLTRGPLKVSLYMFLMAGAFMIMGVYFIFLFLNQRKEYPLLIFSLICFIFLSLLLMEYLKLFYLYEYPFQRTRLEIIDYLHISLALLVPMFFMLQFSFPWKKILLSILVLFIIYFEYKCYHEFDDLAIQHNKLMWLASVIVVAYGCYKKRRTAYVVLGGLIAAVSVIFLMPEIDVNWVSHFDITLFIGFIFIVLSMLYSMSIKRREEQKAYEASLVHSERLKNELLKKNIKPHFIMNTLTSLIDWVEESPKDGVKFINALASEFEVLNQVADHQLVPIEQEIKLCKSHLKVMGFRKEITYVWEDVGIDNNEIIPPAIIHTAVENGVTHSLPDEEGKIILRLTFKRTADAKTYSLQTIAKNREENMVSKKDGTGMKYIKARLQESYPGQWEVRSEENELGWETVFWVLNT